MFRLLPIKLAGAKLGPSTLLTPLPMALTIRALRPSAWLASLRTLPLSLDVLSVSAFVFEERRPTLSVRSVVFAPSRVVLPPSRDVLPVSVGAVLPSRRAFVVSRLAFVVRVVVLLSSRFVFAVVELILVIRLGPMVAGPVGPTVSPTQVTVLVRSSRRLLRIAAQFRTVSLSVAMVFRVLFRVLVVRVKAAIRLASALNTDLVFPRFRDIRAPRFRVFVMVPDVELRSVARFAVLVSDVVAVVVFVSAVVSLVSVAVVLSRVAVLSSPVVVVPVELRLVVPLSVLRVLVIVVPVVVTDVMASLVLVPVSLVPVPVVLPFTVSVVRPVLLSVRRVLVRHRFLLSSVVARFRGLHSVSQVPFDAVAMVLRVVPVVVRVPVRPVLRVRPFSASVLMHALDLVVTLSTLFETRRVSFRSPERFVERLDVLFPSRMVLVPIFLVLVPRPSMFLISAGIRVPSRSAFVVSVVVLSDSALVLAPVAVSEVVSAPILLVIRLVLSPVAVTLPESLMSRSALTSSELILTVRPSGMLITR